MKQKQQQEQRDKQQQQQQQHKKQQQSEKQWHQQQQQRQQQRQSRQQQQQESQHSQDEATLVGSSAAEFVDIGSDVVSQNIDHRTSSTFGIEISEMEGSKNCLELKRLDQTQRLSRRSKKHGKKKRRTFSNLHQNAQSEDNTSSSAVSVVTSNEVLNKNSVAKQSVNSNGPPGEYHQNVHEAINNDKTDDSMKDDASAMADLPPLVSDSES